MHIRRVNQAGKCIYTSSSVFDFTQEGLIQLTNSRGNESLTGLSGWKLNGPMKWDLKEGGGTIWGCR